MIFYPYVLQTIVLNIPEENDEFITETVSIYYIILHIW